ncbi:MAG: hydrogenase maturation nickel metallochaperone HypA/HybF [Candidatus Kariarchaeaceae archaeon]|jgi:hydrogenase nickel incorporation protein HypA/HybF
MHEYGIATILVEKIINEVNTNLGKRVIDVEVEIGEYTFLNFDQIEFCYETLIPDSILEGSKILMNKKEGRVKCDNCSYEGKANTLDQDDGIHFGVLTFMCPNCDGYTRIVEGQDFIIKRIKMVT